jgi:hypothetical protein
MSPTAQVTTNAVGIGGENVVFTQEMVGELPGNALSIGLTVTGPLAYVTSCTFVTLD